MTGLLSDRTLNDRTLNDRTWTDSTLVGSPVNSVPYFTCCVLWRQSGDPAGEGSGGAGEGGHHEGAETPRRHPA